MITEEQLWAYLDGQGPAAARTELEAAIREDENLKARFEEVALLHAGLQDQEAEQPSMAFTARVMERIAALPAVQLYLLSSRQKRSLAIGLSLFLLALLAIGLWAVAHADASAGGQNTLLQGLRQFMSGIPLQAWMLGGSLSLGLGLLALLDRKLSQRRLSLPGKA